MTESTAIRPELAAAVRSVGMQVNRENVLQARAAILAEAKELQQTVQYQRRQEGVGLCSEDPLSPQAAQAFNTRIQALYQQCEAYAAELERAAHALDEVARRYGWTEDEITASFRA